MEKLFIVIIVEFVMLLVTLCIHWIYKDEDHLVWSNDYDIIESLHGEMRNQYIKESKHLDYGLMKALMLSFLLILLPVSSLILAWIIIITVLTISIYAIRRAFRLRKKYKSLIA